MNRVVVTGLGVVSPVGNSAGAYWESLVKGACGIGAPTLAVSERLNQKAVAEVKNFDPLAHFSDRQLSVLDRVSQFAVVAAKEAIAQSGLDLNGELAEQTATIIGTGVGGQTTQEEGYRRLYVDGNPRMWPLTIPKLMVNAPASQITMHCGLLGPSFAVASACASATHAIGVAFHMVRSGSAACAVTGGTEACLTFGTIKSWEAMRVMAPDFCRPFSKDRKGMILGEGAAIAVLESLDSARKRGASILAEVVGFGASSDAKDITSPDEGGMARAIKAAFADAKLSPEDIQYVNAHGTGTLANDATETAALKQAFGPHSSKLAVSSTKSMIGHALGAAGALEFAATALAIRDGIAPPTINFIGPDPACDLDVVPDRARAMPIKAALSNSFAFGGLNAVLALRRFES